MQNTSSHDNQLRHLVYLIENAILNLPEGHEQMVWLIDFSGWSLTNSVPIKTARETINILQNHYPERLAVAFLYNPPRIFETFWKVWSLYDSYLRLVMEVNSMTFLDLMEGWPSTSSFFSDWYFVYHMLCFLCMCI